MSYVKLSYRAVNNKNKVSFTPKKMPVKDRSPSPKIRKSPNMLVVMTHLRAKQMPTQVEPITTQNEPQVEPLPAQNDPMPPAPSAPPADEELRVINIWDSLYYVYLPVGMDIYEALRQYYPSVYEELMKEEAYLKALEHKARTHKYNDAQMYEEYTNHMDYIEWLYDD